MRLQGQFFDMQGLDLRNARIFSLASDPSLATTDLGRVWFDSANKQAKVWNGTGVDRLTNLVEAVAGADTSLSVALASKTATITLAPASGTQRGTMSTAHYTLVNGATSANSASALVARDASGNFSAGTISAALTGTASNASALGNASLAQVRDFSQTSGTRDHTAINDFDTQVRLSRLDQMAPPTSAVSANNQRFTGLLDPVSPQDAATKNYADNLATGLDAKASVRMATTGALPANTASGGVLTASANGALTVDTITPVVGNRILVKNEATPANHGIYTVTQVGTGSTPWILTRATDADSSTEVTPGMFTFVEEGATMAASSWVLSTPNPITLGTTALNFVQFSGGGTYINGNGLNLSGSTFSVRAGSTGTIAVSATGVDVASNYVGQTSITTLGTVGTGVWQGSPVGIAYGGTGATTAPTARAALGAPGKYAANLPALIAGTGQNVTHSLNSTDVLVMVIDQSTFEVVYMDYTVVDANTVKVTSGLGTAANAYRIVVIG